MAFGSDRGFDALSITQNLSFLQNCHEKGRIPGGAAFSFGPGIWPVRFHSSNVINITTAQADIVKLTV